MYKIVITDETGATVRQSEENVILMSCVSRSGVEGGCFCKGAKLPELAGAIVCVERFNLYMMENDPDLEPMVQRCRDFCADAELEAVGGDHE